MEQVAYLEQTAYPVQFSVDYPDRPLGRLSTAFRIILVIPIAIVLSTVSGYVVFSGPSQAYGVTYIPALSGGVTPSPWSPTAIPRSAWPPKARALALLTPVTANIG